MVARAALAWEHRIVVRNVREGAATLNRAVILLRSLFKPVLSF